VQCTPAAVEQEISERLSDATKTDAVDEGTVRRT